ncbi:hypothetical protein OAU50_01535 [Planctomycetota bacterium]|nr:hypothetical protein [Planctomycetota bacterium]
MGKPKTPYGGGLEPEGAVASGPRGLNFVFLGGAACMLIGFILPWISIDAGNMSISMGGWEIPIEINKAISQLIAMLQGSSGQDPEQLEKLQSLKTTVSSLYAVYLIPILCIGAAVVEFITFKKGRNWWWSRAVATVSPIIAFIVVFIAFTAFAAQMGLDSSSGPSPAGSPKPSGGPSMFDVMGAGVYISFIGFLAAAVGIFTNPKPKPTAPARPRRPRPAPGGAPKMPGAAPGVRAGPKATQATLVFCGLPA